MIEWIAAKLALFGLEELAAKLLAFFKPSRDKDIEHANTVQNTVASESDADVDKQLSKWERN